MIFIIITPRLCVPDNPYDDDAHCRNKRETFPIVLLLGPATGFTQHYLLMVFVIFSVRTVQNNWNSYLGGQNGHRINWFRLHFRFLHSRDWRKSILIWTGYLWRDHDESNNTKSAIINFQLVSESAKTKNQRINQRPVPFHTNYGVCLFNVFLTGSVASHAHISQEMKKHEDQRLPPHEHLKICTNMPMKHMGFIWPKKTTK